MDIFKLNYQFQSDFHNFLNVISISNWCCDAKTNNGPYSMSAASVAECYNIWGWGDGGGPCHWCVISAVIHWEGLFTITSVTGSPSAKSANIWMLIGDELITCRLLIWYVAPYFYLWAILKLLKQIYGSDWDHWSYWYWPYNIIS